MLTEQFVAAISSQTKANTGVTKDAAIFVHEHQPLAAQRHVLKKSATASNGLAVSSTHIFAAQAEKATVHVYSRDKWNQEAIVPFPERIRSIALAADDTVLLLGTDSGRILAWEISSGRLVSTSTSHLQSVTSLAVDATSSFFLSGSPDAMIHVWALPAILAFAPDASRSPVHTLSTHRAPISSIVCGHNAPSANLAVSVSEDKSAIVWDYYNGQALRTYLLPELPRAIALDPADRAFHLSYQDGTLQTVDFYDQVQKSTAIDTLRHPASSHRPVQPPPKTRFGAESQKLGTALSLSLSFDGQTLLSGHETGKIAAWDIAKGTYLSTPATLPGPVTNLQFLKPTGFPNASEPTFQLHSVVKPKQDTATSDGRSIIPPNYSVTMQLTGQLHNRTMSATKAKSPKSAFDEAFTHPSFPQEMLDASLAELASWNPSAKSNTAPAADFLSLDENAQDNGTAGSVGATQATEIEGLKKQLASLQRVQKVTFQQLSELREENEHLLAQAKAKPHSANGSAAAASTDEEMSDASSGSDGS